MLVLYSCNTRFAKEYNLTFFTYDRGVRTTSVFHYTQPVNLGVVGGFLNVPNATLPSFFFFTSINSRCYFYGTSQSK